MQWFLTTSLILCYYAENSGLRKLELRIEFRGIWHRCTDMHRGLLKIRNLSLRNSYRHELLLYLLLTEHSTLIVGLMSPKNLEAKARLIAI